MNKPGPKTDTKTENQIDFGIEILMQAREQLANETRQPHEPLTNRVIAEVVAEVTGSSCSIQTISHTHCRAIRKLRRHAPRHIDLNSL